MTDWDRTYFLLATETRRVKIGHSIDPRARHTQINSVSAEPLNLLGWILGNCESELHERFRQHRVRGEWFEATTEIMEFIEGAAGFEEPIDDGRQHQSRLEAEQKAWESVERAMDDRGYVIDKYLRAGIKIWGHCLASVWHGSNRPLEELNSLLTVQAAWAREDL